MVKHKLSQKNYHLSKIVNKASKVLGITEPIIVTWTRARRGKSVPAAKIIFIPDSAFKYGLEYLTYYIVHELCHFIDPSHDDSFKALERKALAAFDLEIEYKGDYAKSLAVNGQIVFDADLGEVREMT